MFSVLSVQKIFDKFNFDLIDAHPQITHGGSMRYVIARKSKKNISPKIKTIIKEEVSREVYTFPNDDSVKGKKKEEFEIKHLR